MGNEMLGDFFGKQVKRTEEIKICIHPNCSTILNPYRAVDNEVCSIHTIWLTEEEDKNITDYKKNYYYRNREELLIKQKIRRDKKRGLL